ncbi:MAG: 30S ribosomal protein S4 [Candidatus Bathyarchaeia archaeon]
MGDPKKPKKKYESPRFPWRSDVLQNELVLLGQYGLRNKRELWRAKTMLSKFRGVARSLLGMSAERRVKLEAQLLGKLKRLGMLPENAVLDDVLDMTVENILERRLQTIVFRKGLAKTPYQARQLIVHGHIAVNGRVVYSPGYLVSKDEEESVTYAPASPLSNPDHPLRISIEAAPKAEGGVRAG